MSGRWPPGRGLFAVLLAAALFSSSRLVQAAEDQYQDMRFEGQIIHGQPAPDKAFPEVVRITFRPSALSEGRGVCTGTLLSNQHAVLTAGHCSCGITQSYRFIPKQTFDLTFDADKKDRLAMRAIREPIRFPGFSCVEGADNSGRDLALFFVRDVEEQTSETSVNPAVPPPPQPDLLTRIVSMHTIFSAGEKQLVVAGYGITEDGTFSRTLEWGRVGIGSYFCSQGNFAGTPCSGFHEFVLGSAGASASAIPVDTCNGDSGGPVYWFPPEQADVFGVKFLPPPALVGVTSRALLYGDHLPGMLCGGGGVYTAVGHSDVLNWLQAYGVQIRTVELGKAPKAN